MERSQALKILRPRKRDAEMSTFVPPPPLPQQQAEVVAAKPAKKEPLAAPLDAAFLGRTYVTTLWLGFIWTLLAWSITQSPKATGSFAGGLFLGALLLKSQEIFVRRVLSPRSKADSPDILARIPIALLLPVKYIVIGLAFGILIECGWLHPIALAAGFLTQQVVIISKVIGRFAANRLRADKPMDDQEKVADKKNDTPYVAF